MHKQTLRALLILLILAFNFLLRFPFLHVPLERDEGEYAYIAAQITDGGVPYRDAFNQKSPGIFYLYALIFSLFGTNVAALRLFVAFYNLISIFFIYRIGRKLADREFGLVAALVFSIVSSERRLLGFSANTEIFMLAPGIAAMYFVVRFMEQRRLPQLALAGILFGVSALIKQPALLNFVAAGLFLAAFAVYRRENVPAAFGNLAALSFSCLLPLAATLFCFLRVGASGDFLYQVLWHNFDYIAREVPNAEVVKNLAVTLRFMLQSQGLLWVLCIFGVVCTLGKRSAGFTLMAAWLAVAMIEVSLGKRFTLHYFLQLAPPFAIVAALGFCRLMALLGFRQNGVPRRGSIFGAVLLFIVALPVYANYRYFSYTPAQLSRLMYTESPFIEAVAAGEFLKANSRPGDRIFVVGSEPEILFYSQRRSASKYIIFYPLTSTYPDTLLRQKEVVAAVTQSPPAYIVYVNYPVSLAETPVQEHYIFDQVAELLRTGYQLTGVVSPSLPGTVCAGKALARLQKTEPDLYRSRRIFIYRRNPS